MPAVLAKRDAFEADADRILTHGPASWPPMPLLAAASPYRARFKQGATIVPRRFFIVERALVGRLGGNPAAPMVRGKAGIQDKAPWRDIDPPHGPVEVEFLRPVLLGESLTPFRLLPPIMAVVPVDGRAVLDACSAANAGHRHLAAWLRDVEQKWSAFSSQNTDGLPRMTLLARLDHMRGYSAQLPIRPIRVVYAASGTLPAAVIVEDLSAIVEHSLYWASVRSKAEGRFLTAILNSEVVRNRGEQMQPKGQGGARHFDNLVWKLRIPEYSSRVLLHRALERTAVIAEQVAAGVTLTEGAYFTTSRRAVRDALAADGIAARIDRLVVRLLDG